MSSGNGSRPRLQTKIGWADERAIFVRGHNLTEELMGRLSFTQMILLTLNGCLPTQDEARLLDAVLISLVDHGITPNALTARVTYAMAPESVQGAVAAGLLGAGSAILGSMEGCGRLLAELDEALRKGGEGDRAERVREYLRAYTRGGRRIPGLGHALHRGGDPRAARLFALAEEAGYARRFVPLLREVAVAAEALLGKALPINVTGAVAAVLLELGIEWPILRGFALLSRTVGLLAHIREEREAPLVPAFRQILLEAQGVAREE